MYLHGHADMRAVPAGAPGPRRTPASAVMAVARGARRRRHRHRRCRDLRPLQLLPGAGVQHLRRHGHGARRSARPDPDRRPAVLRRRRQQLLDARHRRNGGPNAECARAIRSGRRQRRHPEQVLGRRVLHHAGGMEAGPQRAVAGAGRRVADAVGDRKGGRPRHRRDLHGAPRRRPADRHHHRPARPTAAGSCDRPRTTS